MTGRFPDGFVWGVATAAHQVEGNNLASDYWLLEHTPGTGFTEPSGDACDQWHRYREDLGLIAALGLGAYRFSIEWAKIEPEEGHFSHAVLEHYRRLLGACREHGLLPVVTYHHFTTPRWVTADGGWTDERTADRFARFCERATAHLGDLIGMACTINEPNTPILVSHALRLEGRGLEAIAEAGLAEAARRCGVPRARFQPFLFADAARTRDVMVAAHVKARDAIKGSRRRDFPVGVTLAMQDDQAAPGGEAVRDRVRRELYGAFLEAARADDFVGVQTYTRMRWGPDGMLGPEPGVPTLVMGYEFWPEALEGTIRYAAREARVPIHVTENGIGTDDDEQRIAYVRRALAGVGRCLADGIDVRSYFYWSLLDNFEWLYGYGPRFGIVEVDRTSQARRVKASGRFLGTIARANALDVERPA
jgi:beta-glucosidase